MFLKNAEFCSQGTMLPGEDEMVDFNSEIKAKMSAHLMVTVKDNYTLENLMNIDKFSDLLRLLRITAYVLRFIKNMKKRKEGMEIQNSKHLKAFEIREALCLWIRENQLHLKKSEEYEQIMTQLNCKIDDEIIRCYGRMKYANVPDYTKAPVLLSRKITGLVL